VKHNIKQGISFLLIALVVFASFVSGPAVQAKELELEAKAAILVDAETGKVLYAKDPDTALPPASMTKMMTEYLVWEAIESGDIDWETTTQISDYPYSISADNTFSGVGLTQNKDYTVRQLYEAMAINSDNATTIALAELIAGSEGEFVKLMNKKGKEMGLPDFEFVNASGLDNESLGGNHPKGTDADGINMMSARSSALLAYHLVKDYPEALEISSMTEADFDDQKIRNWNYMLPHEASYLKQFAYEGVDGLKTGFTDRAGFNFTGTAERDDKRLISVVMNTDSEEARFNETAKLFDYGFNEFTMQEVFPEGYEKKDEPALPVAKGKVKDVKVAIKDAVKTPVKKGDEENYSLKYHIDKDKLNKDGKLKAPIKKGEKVGTAELVFDGDDYGYLTDKDKHTVELVAAEEVGKKNWFMLALGGIGSFFANLFTTIIDTIKGWF
jgi:D-alanyl-D-alanine carboxypeptidase (penicillin-binding protein 5/6)